MNTYSVTTNIISAQGQNLWIVFEAEASLADLMRAMADGTPVAGYKLDFYKQKDGARVITGRTPLLLAGDSIATVTPCFIEHEERKNAQGSFTVELIRSGQPERAAAQ